LAHLPGRFDIGDVFLDCSRGQQTLWVVMDGDQMIAAFTSRIYQVPKGRICAIELVGGERLSEWFDQGMALFEKYARHYNCIKIEGHGRPGWGKFVKQHDWHHLAESYEKDLT